MNKRKYCFQSTPKLQGIFYIFFVHLVSCIPQTDINILNEPIKIEIAGEGGSFVVELGAGAWNILEILTKTEDHKIFGDTYTSDGKLIDQNIPLSLEGFGSLISLGSKVGFRIEQSSSGVLQIELRENASGDPYGFLIVLQNGEEIKKVYVDQKASAGYSFEGIEFYLSEGDKDSTYMRNHASMFDFDYVAAMEVQVYPFNGQGVGVNSYFDSQDPDAFIWFENDIIEIKIPTTVHDGQVYVSDMKTQYSIPYHGPYLPDYLARITVPAGKSTFTTHVEMRKRKVSYTLKMKSRATKEIKEIHGRWTEISPTGTYEVTKLD